MTSRTFESPIGVLTFTTDVTAPQSDDLDHIVEMLGLAARHVIDDLADRMPAATQPGETRFEQTHRVVFNDVTVSYTAAFDLDYVVPASILLDQLRLIDDTADHEMRAHLLGPAEALMESLTTSAMLAGGNAGGGGLAGLLGLLLSGGAGMEGDFPPPATPHARQAVEEEVPSGGMYL